MMLKWSRAQVFGSPGMQERQEFAEVPGGVIVRVTQTNAPPCMVFVPGNRVYDAGGQGGPFMMSEDNYKSAMDREAKRKQDLEQALAKGDE